MPAVYYKYRRSIEVYSAKRYMNLVSSLFHVHAHSLSVLTRSSLIVLSRPTKAFSELISPVLTKLRCFISYSFRYHLSSLHSCQF